MLKLNEIFYPRTTLLSGCFSAAAVAINPSAHAGLTPLSGGIIGASTVTAFFLIREGLAAIVRTKCSKANTEKLGLLVNLISGFAACIIGMGLTKYVVGAASFKASILVIGVSALPALGALAIAVGLIYAAFSCVGSARKP